MLALYMTNTSSIFHTTYIVLLENKPEEIEEKRSREEGRVEGERVEGIPNYIFRKISIIDIIQIHKVNKVQSF